MKPTAKGTGDYFELDYTEKDMQRFIEIYGESGLMKLARKVLDKRNALLTQPILITTPKYFNKPTPAEVYNKILEMDFTK